MKRLTVFALLILLVLTTPAQGAETLTLLLDWYPNVDHLPIYIAREGGYFSNDDITLEILSPSDTADALKLAASGRVDVAVSYQPQTIVAAAEGIRINVVGRLVEHPLTTLLFLKGKGITSPADLAGKRVGYTVPGMMDVLMEAFAKINGIGTYTSVNVGFAIVQSLTAGRVDAIMGPFKTYETVALDQRGYSAGYFELEKWGIPDYDELIFVSGSKAAREKADLLNRFSKIVQRGIDEARANPEKALADYFRAVPEADRRTETEAFELTRPFYAHDQKHDPVRWQQFADFALTYGLINQPVDVTALLVAR